jgi:acetolactate synthase-1/2/3 large subunit
MAGDGGDALQRHSARRCRPDQRRWQLCQLDAPVLPLSRVWPKDHKTQLAPTNGAMGYGVPAGIAASLLTGRTAFTIAGDGDFLMNGQELATAVQHGARSIIVLLNNGMYGTIRMHQEREYPARVSGSALRNPDFAALALAYGYVGVRITRTEEFEPELLAALARGQGTLIEVILDPEVITTRTTLAAISEAASIKKRS